MEAVNLSFSFRTPSISWPLKNPVCEGKRRDVWGAKREDEETNRAPHATSCPSLPSRRSSRSTRRTALRLVPVPGFYPQLSPCHPPSCTMAKRGARSVRKYSRKPAKIDMTRWARWARWGMCHYPGDRIGKIIGLLAVDFAEMWRKVPEDIPGRYPLIKRRNKRLDALEREILGKCVWPRAVTNLEVVLMWQCQFGYVQEFSDMHLILYARIKEFV